MQKRILHRINTFIDFSPKNILFLIILLILFALSAFSCFYALGRLPVNSWDEARHGVNAYEMMKNGNYLINTYNYKPDYWNLKPPLSFWAIILGFKLFGAGVTGLRFYSAVSMFLIILICTLFVYKQYGKLACILTIGSLSTYQIFYVYHFVRSGDADALFALFFTVGIISLFYLNKNIRFLYVNGLCFALAFLTKSWHAMLIPAICIIYLLISGEFKRVKAKNLVVFLLCSLLPVLAWVVLRYRYDGTTFFIHMVNQDLLARSSQVVENHKGGIFYYLYYFSLNWVGVLFIAASIYFVIGLAVKKKTPAFLKNVRAHKSSLLFALWILVPSVLYSMAKTKIEWYIFPALIPFIMMVSVMCSRIIKQARLKFIRYGFIVLTIFVFSINCWGNVGQIIVCKSGGIQNFIIKDVAKVPSVKGDEAYMILNGGNWSQDNTFLSEAYADLKCKNGGLDSFLNSRNSVALDSLNDYNKNIAHFKGAKIISKDQTYVLILK